MHQRSLISAFVVRRLDSIISLDSIAEISRLASFCGCAGRFLSGPIGISWRHILSCRGSYIKSWKKLYKIRLQRHFFETCNKWMKLHFYWHQNFVLWGLSAPASGLYTGCPKKNVHLLIPPVYKVCRGYIVFVFSVTMCMFVCVFVNFSFFVKDFSGTSAPRILKFATNLWYDLLYFVKQNPPPPAYHSLYLSIFFLSLNRILISYESQSLQILYTPWEEPSILWDRKPGCSD